MRIALPAVLSAAALGARPDGPVLTLSGETMGTRWSVRLVAPPGLDPDVIGEAIVARLDGIVAEMSHWSKTSLLSRFNRSAAGSWTALPPDFAHVMADGLRIAAATGGAFDPAIGRLVDLAGFGPVPPTELPTPADIAAARAASGWDKLQYDPAGRRLRQPGGLSLDLSGIAKGHAVDAVAGLLAAAGVRHCLVEIGGELAGRGLRPDGAPWWVDLEVPPGVDLPPLRIALHDLAVATSGDYARGAHTLDPRTGKSITNGVVSASVIHPSAMVADAWATALTVMGAGAGAGAGIAAATTAGLAGRIVEAGGGEHLTPALEAMLAE